MAKTSSSRGRRQKAFLCGPCLLPYTCVSEALSATVSRLTACRKLPTRYCRNSWATDVGSRFCREKSRRRRAFAEDIRPAARLAPGRPHAVGLAKGQFGRRGARAQLGLAVRCLGPRGWRELGGARGRRDAERAGEGHKQCAHGEQRGAAQLLCVGRPERRFGRNSYHRWY